MILTNSGVLKLMQRIKSFITSQLNTKANSVHTHTLSEIDDLSSLQMGGGYTKSEVDTLLNGKADTGHTHSKSQITDFPSYGTTANTICEGNDSRLSDARTPTAHTHTKSEITDFPNLSTVATSGSYNDLSNKPTIPTVNNATLTIQKNGTTVKTFTANASSDVTCNITVPTKTSELTNDSCIPLSGTTSITGSLIPSVANVAMGSNSHSFSTIHVGIINLTSTTIKRNENSSGINICGGNEWRQGGTLTMYGKDSSTNTGCFILSASDGTSTFTLNGSPSGTLTWNGDIFHSKSDAYFRKSTNNGNHVLCGGTGWFEGGSVQVNGKDRANDSGCVGLHPCINEVSNSQWMLFKPDGTWTWTGTAVQLTSDKRLKQQITQIDNALLDAWQEVELVQFKYNDAVNEKGNAARLHTGYVVQQINEACQKHNIDISEYGLYCHEEYPERTEEVTVQNEDGTTKKETRVIEEASEHYSLRYTETLVVECAYLRRENARLKERLQQHDDYFSNIEKRLQSLENS